VVAALLVYAFSNHILVALGNQLIHSDPLQRADAIVVLAPRYDRVVTGAELYRQGYAPVVVLTRELRELTQGQLIERGVIESGEEQRRKVLVAYGVPPAAIVVLPTWVDSTADEARAFAEWAARHSIKRVIVVTSPLHTARSRLTFTRAVENLEIEVLVRPSSVSSFRSETWWRSRTTFREGLLELQKLIYYRLVEVPRMTPLAATSVN
jgi:uncharacterized SAM-binding protein YcdF (DUF218 family)